MRQKIISLVLLSLVVIATGFLVNATKHSSTGQLQANTIPTGLPTTMVILSNAQHRQTFKVEIATTTIDQAKGLSGRLNMAQDHGMLFVFKPASKPDFWMKDMEFPLDMVWIKDNRIIQVSRNLSIPQTGQTADQLPLYSPPDDVDYVIELNGNAAKDFAVGDRVDVVDALAV